MNTYARLTSDQIPFLLRLAESCSRTNCYVWRLWSNQLICNVTGKDERVHNVPTQLSFYYALQDQGFIRAQALEDTVTLGVEPERLEMTVHQKTLDFAEFYHKGGRETMDMVAESQRKRFVYLQALYLKTKGNELSDVGEEELGSELGFTAVETDLVTRYLTQEGLATCVSGGRIYISHLGVVEIEKALTNPQERTQYFPPVVNVISVQQMYGSQIQQSTHGSTQTGTYNCGSLQGTIDAIRQARDEISEISLSEDDRAEADAEIQTLEAQTKSPRPKLAIITAAWGTLLRIVESAGPTILAEVIRKQLALPGG